MAYRGPDPKFESLTATESLSGSAVQALVTNTSNTASSQAKIIAQVAGGTADDAVFQAIVNGVTTWSWGVDNSASDAFVISASATLGTTNGISISTAGAVTMATVDIGALTVASIALGSTLETNYAFSSKVAGNTTDQAIFAQYSASGGGAQLGLARSNSASINTHTIVASGDIIGSLDFLGSNGTAFGEAASIRATVDATPGAVGDMPGRLGFFTTPDGSATRQERLRLNNAGQAQFYETLNSASTPTISFLGDTDTGLYSSAANTLNFATNGTSQLSINSTGVITTTASLTVGTNLTVTSPFIINVDEIRHNTVGSAVKIKGVTDGTAATASYVGEVLVQSRLRSASAAIATGTSANVTGTALTLTAGSWILQGSISFSPAATTSITQLVASISTTSATLSASDTTSVYDVNGQMRAVRSMNATVPGANDITVDIPPHPVNISGNTTFYLVQNTTFTVSTMNAYGSIYAVRIR